MRSSRWLMALMGAALLTGCMSWTPGWEVLPVPAAGGNPSEALARGEALFGDAGDAVALRLAIDALEQAVAADPSSGAALERLAEARILYGAAYAVNRDEKTEWYTSGVSAAEQAMATNREFRRRVEEGATVGDAVSSLGRDEMRAMLFWVTGVSYYFKECLRGPARAIHFRWMLRTREVMERMLEIDPEYEKGAVLFSVAIYHIASPPGAGRDMGLAAEYFERAIAAGPESLLVRWGRAKYVHTGTGDRAEFRKDLEWVLARDPRTASSTYAWNGYFQRDARSMLELR
jgi:tetratricopeptide (TPR) repeat protein